MDNQSINSISILVFLDHRQAHRLTIGLACFFASPTLPARHLGEPWLLVPWTSPDCRRFTPWPCRAVEFQAVFFDSPWTGSCFVLHTPGFGPAWLPSAHSDNRPHKTGCVAKNAVQTCLHPESGFSRLRRKWTFANRPSASISPASRPFFCWPITLSEAYRVFVANLMVSQKEHSASPLLACQVTYRLRDKDTCLPCSVKGYG